LIVKDNPLKALEQLKKNTDGALLKAASRKNATAMVKSKKSVSPDRNFG
jgi:hypothetical protein